MTAFRTYGVCVEGVMPDDDHEFEDGALALEKANEIKDAESESLVTVVLWDADPDAVQAATERVLAEARA